jgi:hypothetical protein
MLNLNFIAQGLQKEEELHKLLISAMKEGMPV